MTSSLVLGDALTAVLLQITAHAERLAVLDEREATHHQQTADRLTELGRQSTSTSDRLGEVLATAAKQAAVLGSLTASTSRSPPSPTGSPSSSPAKTTATAPDGDSYRPPPAPPGGNSAVMSARPALARLRAWVEQVYAPASGTSRPRSAPAGTTPLCLFGLDWLMELWSALYLTPERDTSDLAGEAEWQIRLLPALAEQMHLETTRCQHRQPGHPPAPARTDGPAGWRRLAFWPRASG